MPRIFQTPIKKASCLQKASGSVGRFAKQCLLAYRRTRVVPRGFDEADAGEKENRS